MTSKHIHYNVSVCVFWGGFPDPAFGSSWVLLGALGPPLLRGVLEDLGIVICCFLSPLGVVFGDLFEHSRFASVLPKWTWSITQMGIAAQLRIISAQLCTIKQNRHSATHVLQPNFNESQCKCVAAVCSGLHWHNSADRFRAPHETRPRARQGCACDFWQF